MDKLSPKPKLLRRSLLKFLGIFESDLKYFSELDMAHIGSGLLAFNIAVSLIVRRKKHKYLHFTSKIVDPGNLVIEGNGAVEFRKSLASSPSLYLQCHNTIFVHCSVLLGPAVKLIGANHLVEDDRNDHELSAPIKIKAGVWIGAGGIVLPGITIGKNAIVGAGSIVVKHVDSGSLVAGNPARLIRKL